MLYLDFFPPSLDAATTVALSVAVGISMVGMAIAFIAAEPRSPVTRAFVVAYGLSGFAAALEISFIFLYPEGSVIPWFARFDVILLIGLMGFPLWLLRVARMAQPTERAMLWIARCVYLQWALALVFFVYGGVYAEARLYEFYLCLGRPEFLPSTESKVLAGLILAGTVNMTFGGSVLFTQKIDLAERRRVLAFAASFPFIACIFILPAGYNVLAILIGIMIFLLGAIRYYVIQGERGLYMSRFLSPQVVDMVRRRGMEHTMQPRSLEITVVCCDLRGFTRLSQILASDQVIRLLNEYYETVGNVVAEFGATIKDYAGDGILILVGAPVPISDHAQRGLALARKLNRTVHAVIANWICSEQALGAGIGVASGRVTVGAIGSAARMEYTAVGQAVNFAARLCARAQDGEILVSPQTVELVGAQGFELRDGMSIQGMEGQQLFAMAQASSH